MSIILGDETIYGIQSMKDKDLGPITIATFLVKL